MRVVHHDKSHSMRWCLDCHKAPEKHLRPMEEVFSESTRHLSDQDRAAIAAYLKALPALPGP